MSKAITPEWIAVDWGTSRLRVWAIDSAGEILARGSSNRGMNALDGSEFEPALLELVEPWLVEGQRTVIVCCGMVGAKQGWAETQYHSVPFASNQPMDLLNVETLDNRLNVHIVPGLKQSHPADVMRGEETQIAGLLAANPSFTGTLCLPGTHSKWVKIEEGTIKQFSTFMTGELFALLSKLSVLRFCIVENGWDRPEFLRAIQSSISAPQNLSNLLFGLRASSLISNLSPNAASARLSGLLLGQELAGTIDYWRTGTIEILGEGELADKYEEALQSQNVTCRKHDPEQMTLAGLRRAFDGLEQADDR